MVAATPAPAAFNIAPIMQPISDSGSSDSSLTDMFKSLNFVEIGFGVLGVFALFQVSNYYRYNLNVTKKSTTEIQNKIDDLSIKLSDIKSKFEDSQQQQQSQQQFF